MKWLQIGIFMVAVLISARNAQADTTWVAAGFVSGTWSAAHSPYMINNGSIGVLTTDTLTIQPGVEIYFDGPFMLEVQGILRAIGTEQDSIRFTASVHDTSEISWRGINFLDARDTSRISFAVLEHANGPGMLNGTGGAIQCHNCSPRINHCSIRENHAVLTQGRQAVSRRGGGVYIYGPWYGGPIFTDCEFTANNPGPVGLGGAVACDTTQAQFIRCVMRGDTAGGGGAVAVRWGTPRFEHCDISQNIATWDGGGVHVEGGFAVFDSCTISNNVSSQCGGAIYVIAGNPRFQYCEISWSESFWGGAVYCSWSPAPVLDHCRIHNNIGGLGGALYAWQANPQVLSSTLAHNTSTQGDGGAVFLNQAPALIRNSILAYSTGGEGVFFLNSPQAEVRYCDVAVNSGGAFDYYPDTDAMPPYLGHLSQTNANLDSCDAYWNILLEPQFMDAPGGDYHLNWDSPCIDAGDPLLPHDPDGTIADIGAFYRDAVPAALPPTRLPREVALAQNYPNPFNAATQITFSLPTTGAAELEVYDLTGRLVTTLFAGNMTAGTHHVNFNASRLPSGVYLYRLTTANVSLTKKLVLIK